MATSQLYSPMRPPAPRALHARICRGNAYQVHAPRSLTTRWHLDWLLHMAASCHMAISLGHGWDAPVVSTIFPTLLPLCISWCASPIRSISNTVHLATLSSPLSIHFTIWLRYALISSCSSAEGGVGEGGVGGGSVVKEGLVAGRW